MNHPEEQGVSWNTHSILTRASLGRLRLPILSKSVQVEPLEEFLFRARSELTTLEEWHSELIAAKSRVAPSPGSEEHRVWSTESDLLAGFRLNPDYRFDYVRALQPDEVDPNAAYNPSREGPPGNAYVDVEPSGLMPALDVLATFSDEPDWGLDQNLFIVEQYGYGPPAFGPWNGISSQAPFHMSFFHERPIMLLFFPQLRRSFLEERVRVFFRLSELAFRKSVDYWGWRFTAWALHYLQDLTQPYHAKPFPPSLLKLIGRILRDPHPRGFSERNRNCLVNHHILFEAAVHFLLNQAVRNDPDHVFLRALAPGDEIAPTNLAALLQEASRTAARLAKEMDRTAVKLFKLTKLDNADYFLGEDPLFHVDKLLPPAAAERPRIFELFLQLVSNCLIRTGAVTRYVAKRAGNMTQVLGGDQN